MSALESISCAESASFFRKLDGAAELVRRIGVTQQTVQQWVMVGYT